VNALSQLLASLQIHPVLVEVGTIDSTPPIWNPIAGQSIYLGIGPDSKRLGPSLREKFGRCLTSERVITPGREKDVSLFLTKDPIYTSVLKPMPDIPLNFANLDLALEGSAAVRATTLEDVLSGFSLESIDWLLTNVNGIDQRLYLGFDDRIRARIMALDTCLDLMEVYAGQDRSLELYQRLTGEGLWLSTLKVCGPVKLSTASLHKLGLTDEKARLCRFHKETPGWLFARFFRTLEHLRQIRAASRDYVVLWCFALLDGQIGFAADVAFEYEQVFGNDGTFIEMRQETARRAKALARFPLLRKRLDSYVPEAVKDTVRKARRSWMPSA
jgi:hypothetical protein